MHEHHPEDQFLLSLADIKALFRRHRFKMLSLALIGGIVGVLFALTSPIRYQAEGTFRDKGVKSTGASSSFLQFLGGSGLAGGESEAASLMTSRKLLKDVIDRLHLQAKLETISDLETLPRLIKDNLKLTWFFMPFHHSPKPVLPDPALPLKIESLSYSGEVPLALWMELEAGGRYELFDLFNSKQSLGYGELGKPFQWDRLSLVLAPCTPDQPIAPLTLCLTLQSLPDTVKALCRQVKIESTKSDKSLLKLSCEDRSRFAASAIINEIMWCYQNYLKDYHQELAATQLNYLSERSDQLKCNLTHLMEKHADYLASGVNHSGFIETGKEIDFFAQRQHEYKHKLIDNELEIKRLKHIHPANWAYYDRHTLGDGGDSVIINPILSDMRQLKQQRDSLEISLQKKSSSHGKELQHSFEQQLDELQEVQQYLAETRKISQEYREGHLPDIRFKLVHDPRFLLKVWLERLHASKQGEGVRSREFEENFKFYLNNLERSFEVHERILQERLTHQQNPSEEYQGISLEVATELYLNYSRQTIQMEETIRQNTFLIGQIEEPEFEISSLSAVLSDPISTTIVQKASQLLLNLRDENNQSMREQERIKSDLRLQRTFLTLHLRQMIRLMELNKQLFDEKIFALQNMSLELIHQRISLLEKNLQDYLASRLDNLQQERQLIKRQLEGIHNQMALLPPKWVSEKMLTQEVETHQRIVEELTTLVESKNIAHKLEVIQSSPLDLSIPPVHPVKPKVFFFGFIGFFLGGLLGMGIALGKTLNKEI